MLSLGAVLSFSAAIVGRMLLAAPAALARFWAAALVVCTVSVPVSAQSVDDLERGRALYREGLSLEAAGDWKAALQKFEDVARIRLTPQVRFHMARTKEHLGRWTEALGDYRMAEYDAARVKAQELGLISEARRALQRRVPRLVIEQRGPRGLLRLALDGVELGQNQLGLELAVDPGRHTVEAVWADGAKLEQTVDSREGQTTRVLLRQPESSASSGGLESTAGPARSELAAPRGRRVWPIILGSVGLAGIATGAGLMYLRQEALNQLERACGPDHDDCPDSLQGTYDRGKLYSWLGPVVGGAGVAAVGAAITLWFINDPRREEQTASGPARLFLVSSTGGAGVAFVGSF
jgi:tetratricopeptide (TPR) repeat protein